MPRNIAFTLLMQKRSEFAENLGKCGPVPFLTFGVHVVVPLPNLVKMLCLSDPDIYLFLTIFYNSGKNVRICALLEMKFPKFKIFIIII